MRKPFNWSLLDRDMLQTMLYSARNQVVGKTLPTAALHKILVAHIKSHLPIKVVKKIGPKQKQKLIYVGGTYYSDFDQAGKRQIEVIFSYHPDDVELKITNHKWLKICRLFADTVLHEIVHMKQYRSRGFKTIDGYESVADCAELYEDQSYYGHKDEIGAFSFNIACELHSRFNGSSAAIFEYLNSNAAKKHKSSTYTKYLDAFAWDHKHKVIKKLKRKILQQLPTAALGKPFSSPIYLNY